MASAFEGGNLFAQAAERPFQLDGRGLPVSVDFRLVFFELTIKSIAFAVQGSGKDRALFFQPQDVDGTDAVHVRSEGRKFRGQFSDT